MLGGTKRIRAFADDGHCVHDKTLPLRDESGLMHVGEVSRVLEVRFMTWS